MFLVFFNMHSFYCPNDKLRMCSRCRQAHIFQRKPMQFHTWNLFANSLISKYYTSMPAIWKMWFMRALISAIYIRHFRYRFGGPKCWSGISCSYWKDYVMAKRYHMYVCSHVTLSSIRDEFRLYSFQSAYPSYHTLIFRVPDHEESNAKTFTFADWGFECWSLRKLLRKLSQCTPWTTRLFA